MQITDFEFALVRQRNQILADANAAIDAQNREIAALRGALTSVKNQLITERAEKVSLQIRLQRARQRH